MTKIKIMHLGVYSLEKSLFLGEAAEQTRQAKQIPQVLGIGGHACATQARG